MGVVWHFLDICLHLDNHLDELAASYGPWLYVLMFAVIFCETGLVVTPILPGDSLLFAFGMLTARQGPNLSVWFSAALLIVASIAGDAVNYWIGWLLGPKVFHYDDDHWLLNKKHLLRTHEFYERHGGQTIVLARFIPIVRTFAPFVAGIARMGYVRFWQFNCVGGTLWVLLFLLGGYYFGNIPLVRNNFTAVMMAIVLVSVIPMGIEFLRARRQSARKRATPIPVEAPTENLNAKSVEAEV